MSSHAETTKKRLLGMFSLWCPPARVSRETDETVVLTSPKVYESGIITRLDLRLVDVYGDCAIESEDVLSAPVEHEPIC